MTNNDILPLRASILDARAQQIINNPKQVTKVVIELDIYQCDDDTRYWLKNLQERMPDLLFKIKENVYSPLIVKSIKVAPKQPTCSKPVRSKLVRK